MNNTITIEKVNDTQLRMSDNGITTTFTIKLVYDNRTHRNWIELPSNSIKRKYIPDNAFADATTITLEKKQSATNQDTRKTGKKSEIDVLRENLDETDQSTLDELIKKATINIKRKALADYVQQINDLKQAIAGLGLANIDLGDLLK